MAIQNALLSKLRNVFTFRLIKKNAKMCWKVSKLSSVLIVVCMILQLVSAFSVDQKYPQNVALKQGCPSYCHCVWRSGKSSVYCEEARLTKVPFGLPNSTQVLSLQDNHLQALHNKLFLNLGLNHLQRINLAK